MPQPIPLNGELVNALTPWAWISLAISLLGVVWIIFDLRSRPPRMQVMRWVWPLAALWGSVFGIALYRETDDPVPTATDPGTGPASLLLMKRLAGRRPMERRALRRLMSRGQVLISPLPSTSNGKSGYVLSRSIGRHGSIARRGIPRRGWMVGVTKHQQYVTLITCLSYEIVRLRLKLATLTRFREQSRRLNDESVVPLFSTLAESLQIDVILSLAKLFEKRGDNRARSLLRLLEFVEANAKEIEWQHPVTVFDLRRQRALIEARRAEIHLVISQRDMYFEHRGPQWTGRLADITSDLPITSEMLTELLQVAQQILEKHSSAIHGATDDAADAFSTVPLDRMIAAFGDA